MKKIFLVLGILVAALAAIVGAQTVCEQKNCLLYDQYNPIPMMDDTKCYTPIDKCGACVDTNPAPGVVARCSNLTCANIKCNIDDDKLILIKTYLSDPHRGTYNIRDETCAEVTNNKCTECQNIDSENDRLPTPDGSQGGLYGRCVFFNIPPSSDIPQLGSDSPRMGGSLNLKVNITDPDSGQTLTIYSKWYKLVVGGDPILINTSESQTFSSGVTVEYTNYFTPTIEDGCGTYYAVVIVSDGTDEITSAPSNYVEIMPLNCDVYTGNSEYCDSQSLCVEQCPSNPAEETCGDDKDNNCDGQIDENCGSCKKDKQDALALLDVMIVRECVSSGSKNSITGNCVNDKSGSICSKLKEAKKNVEESLCPGYWTDDSRLNPNRCGTCDKDDSWDDDDECRGNKNSVNWFTGNCIKDTPGSCSTCSSCKQCGYGMFVFIYEAKAANICESLYKKYPQKLSECKQVTNLLANADKCLAETALNDAKAKTLSNEDNRKCYNTKISVAQKFLDKSNSVRQKNPVLSQVYDKVSWLQSQSAIRMAGSTADVCKVKDCNLFGKCKWNYDDKDNSADLDKKCRKEYDSIGRDSFFSGTGHALASVSSINGQDAQKLTASIVIIAILASVFVVSYRQK